MKTPTGFKQIYGCHLSADGERIVVCIEMDDGSVRAINWPIEQIVEWSGEIEPPRYAPHSVVLS